jgi:hypothetical protein
LIWEMDISLVRSIAWLRNLPPPPRRQLLSMCPSQWADTSLFIARHPSTSFSLLFVLDLIG